MAIDVEAEIRDRKRRVSEIEGSFGFLNQQIRGVHKDLLAFQARTEQRFDKVDGRFDKVDGGLDRVESGLRGLRQDMPGIVAVPPLTIGAVMGARRFAISPGARSRRHGAGQNLLDTKKPPCLRLAQRIPVRILRRPRNLIVDAARRPERITPFAER